jgi:AcrR family transcriptional regulator
MSESQRARFSAPERGRRSQAERTAETRAKIIEAVVAAIAEVGFQKTTASEITRRSGLTWGAVQHHFGGKDGILTAALEDSFDRFARRLEGLPGEAASLEERVSVFIDRAWEHFSSAHYRSTFEILLNYTPPSGEDPARGPAWQAEMFRGWNEIWLRLFGEVGLPASRVTMIQHYTISVLSGLASMRFLEAPVVRFRKAELDLLKQTLLREFSAPTPATAEKPRA